MSLHEAAIIGDGEALRDMLKTNDPNIRNEEGITPLMLASTANVAKALLASGADVNVQDDMGATPLHHAVDHEAIPIVRILMRAGADPKIPLYNGPNVLEITKTLILHPEEGAGTSNMEKIYNLVRFQRNVLHANNVQFPSYGVSSNKKTRRQRKRRRSTRRTH